MIPTRTVGARIHDRYLPRLEYGAMRQDLPSGTVTFVFTDIAGSTKLLQELGDDRYAYELAEHRETLRAAFARHQGTEVDTQGDAFFIAFPTAYQALDATIEGLQALRRGPIRVRVGIHTGTPLLAAEGYVGTDVHRASRIANAGHGGQVLVSATTAALVDADRFELVDLGSHRLKDLPRPERIFQLGSEVFPPIRSLSRSNLPVPATPFLGRRSELEQVTALLLDPDVHELTLTGPGGIGKTRLALHAAANSAGLFPDGLWWVPLAPLTDPGLALSAMARAIAVEERPGVDLASDIDERLADGNSLMLLDNAEHLLPSLAAEIGPVIGAAKGATFLVTSRAPLHIDAEHEFPVPEMTREDAELFFVSRAKAIGVDLKPASTGLTALCARLDRLPLAMQLAAARLKVFSVTQLIQGLGQLLDLPGKRDANSRQRTLRATIEWSHSLLASDEMAAFRRFSVFAGGATVDAVEEVTGASNETMLALLDQSLLRRRDDDSGPRFWMLETIREFAWERLQEAGEVESTRDRHARFYRSMAERAGIALDGPRGDWLNRLDAELENLRTSISWFLERADHEAAQIVVGSLGVYWLDRGLLAEMRVSLERSLEADGEGGAAHTLALTRLAMAAYLQGDYEQARAMSGQALSQAKILGDPVAIARATESLASALVAEGSVEEAWHLEKEVLEIARVLRGMRPRMLLRALANVGYAALIRAMYDDAVRYSEEAVALALEVGDSSLSAAARCNLAMALIQLGRVEEAARLGAEAMISAIDSADQLLGTDCLEVLAAVETERGNHRSAARLFGSSEALRKILGYELEPAERALHDRTLEIVRNALSDSELRTAWAEGAAMDMEEAFALIGPESLQ